MGQLVTLSWEQQLIHNNRSQGLAVASFQHVCVSFSHFISYSVSVFSSVECLKSTRVAGRQGEPSCGAAWKLSVTLWLWRGVARTAALTPSCFISPPRHAQVLSAAHVTGTYAHRSLEKLGRREMSERRGRMANIWVWCVPDLINTFQSSLNLLPKTIYEARVVYVVWICYCSVRLYIYWG